MIAPKRRVAACIFGLLPRYHFTGSHVEQGTLAVTTAFKADKAEHDFSAERLLQAIVVPSFDQYLVKPNAAGFQVDASSCTMAKRGGAHCCSMHGSRKHCTWATRG